MSDFDAAMAKADAEIAALKAERDALRAALADMLAGWLYVQKTHGDLYGVGWERAQKAAEDALKEPTP